MDLFSALALSGTLVVVIMPALIRVAFMKQLVDHPEEDRKLHKKSTPTIGGVAVFVGFMVSCFIYLPHAYSDLDAAYRWGALMAACVILFFMGVKDDLVGMSPSKKLLIHLLLGGLLIFEGGFKINTFDGLFGLNEIPFYIASFFSLFVYIVIVNAVNLIDGVDGLAGGFGAIAACMFGLLFASAGALPEATISFSMAGALLGFLWFNWCPAKIFLGDGGSLLIGLIFYGLGVQWINMPDAQAHDFFQDIPNPVMSMSILAYPLVDTLRVFTLRISRGLSPFSPDRNHLHHRMMSLGWGHRRTSTMVYLYTFVMVGSAFLLFRFAPLDESALFLIQLAWAFGLFTPILRRSLAKKIRIQEGQDKRHKEGNMDVPASEIIR